MTVATDPRKTGLGVGMTLLAASAVAASVTGTTSETVLATVTIPPLGVNAGVLLVYNATFTNNANNKTLREKLGATTQRTQVGTTAAIWHIRDTIRNRGATNSQSVHQMLFTANGLTNALTTSTEDLSVPKDLVITAQLAVGTDTFTLESFEVWLIPG